MKSGYTTLHKTLHFTLHVLRPDNDIGLPTRPVARHPDRCLYIPSPSITILMPEYTVPEQNLGWLREKVVKLSVRAQKLGVAPVTMTIVGDEQRPFVWKRDMDGRVRYFPTTTNADDKRESLVLIRFVTVEVIGEAPVLAGWKFIGTIQHVRDNGQSATILRAVPGYEIGEYRDADPEWCDECKMSRQRNETFIVESVEGKGRQRVGRQCLKDFLGHPKPEAYAEFAEQLGMLDELFRTSGSEFTGGGDLLVLTEHVINAASAVIAQFGWVSGKMAREAQERDEHLERTSSLVGEFLFRDNETKLVFTPSVLKTAQDALTWARETLPALVAAQPNNDYLYNLSQATKLEAMGHKLIGIAVSLIPAYQREQRKNGTYEDRAARSKHVGVEGVRAALTLTVADLRSITYHDGSNGTVIRFEDADGNEFTWFTGGSHSYKTGETYALKATIKRHDEFRGIKQTVLNRVQKA